MRSVDDRLERTRLTSPVDGFINRIEANTIGGTVRPGDTVMKITPIADSILIEARMSPRDVGFLRVGQEANINLTAYDFLIYCSLRGVIETISSDSLEDERGATYFRVMVRSEDNAEEFNGRSLSVVPGTQAQVDVLTGERTVMHYFMKPILRATQEFFTER